MAKRESKHYSITFYFNDAQEDFSRILEHHFLLLIRKLKKE